MWQRCRAMTAAGRGRRQSSSQHAWTRAAHGRPRAAAAPGPLTSYLCLACAVERAYGGGGAVSSRGLRRTLAAIQHATASADRAPCARGAHAALPNQLGNHLAVHHREDGNMRETSGLTHGWLPDSLLQLGAMSQHSYSSTANSRVDKTQNSFRVSTLHS